MLLPKRWTPWLLAGVLLAAGGTLGAPPTLADTAPASPTEPLTVATDVLPTVQINGVVWDQVIVGNTVYAVGEFTSARPAGSPAGSGSVARSNMLAYNLSTGALINEFAPTFDGVAKVVTASANGTRIFVGGQFTKVSGVNRYRLVSLDAATGAVDTTFSVSANSSVSALTVVGSTLYVGGNFSSLGGAARTKAAAVNLTTRTVLPFAPSFPGGAVFGIAASPDASKIALGGNFVSLNGSNRPGYGLGMVDAATGKVNQPLAVNNLIRNGNTNAAILSLKGDADGFYGSGYAYSKTQGNLEGSFGASWNGNLTFVEDCHGDTYDLQPLGSVVYSASHKHYCGNLGTGGFPQTTPNWTFHRATATTKYATGLAKRDPYGYYNFQGNPTPTLLNFYPDINTGTYTGKTQGAWTVEGNSNYIVYGGEFTQVNGRAQQGLVRFAVKDIAPNDDGPRLAGSTMTPTAAGAGSGAVRLTWTGNWDRDNATLTYRVYRGSTVVGQVVRTASFWQIPTLTYLDATAPPGTNVQYRIEAVDPFGNAVSSGSVAVTVPGTAGGGGGGGAVQLAADAFGRSVSGGWGSAQTGGAWTVAGGSTAFAVDGSQGVINLTTAGAARSALLNAVSSDNTDVSAKVSLDKAGTGSGTYVALVGRSVGSSNTYRAKIRLVSTADLKVEITKTVSGAETTLVSTTLAGVRQAAGDTFAIRFQAVGRNSTDLKAKVWRSGAAEPGAWTLSTTDSTAELQAAGGVGFWTYVSGSTTNVPQAVTVDDLVAVPRQ